MLEINKTNYGRIVNDIYVHFNNYMAEYVHTGSMRSRNQAITCRQCLAYLVQMLADDGLDVGSYAAILDKMTENLGNADGYYARERTETNDN